MYEYIYKNKTLDESLKMKTFVAGVLTIAVIVNLSPLQQVNSENVFREEDVEEHITFWLVTENAEGVQLTNDTLGLVNSVNPIKVLVHGWLSSRFTEWYKQMTEAYFGRGNYTIIQVDWENPASLPEYVDASKNTFIVGRLLGDLISKLNREYKISLKNFELVGHSFGAQISGLAGKRVFELTDSKVWRIIGMDPAGPQFQEPSVTPDRRLYHEDAEIVVTIHTDVGGTGFSDSIGPIDFYPNSGLTGTQPGCNGDATCGHVIVTDFYVEAVQNPKGFVATKCDSYADYLLGVCGNKTVTLGGDFSVADAGDYFFRTNPESPYSKD